MLLGEYEQAERLSESVAGEYVEMASVVAAGEYEHERSDLRWLCTRRILGRQR